jgi:hypothetical protein
MWLNDYRMWRQLKTYTHRVGALEICNMTLYRSVRFQLPSHAIIIQPHCEPHPQATYLQALLLEQMEIGALEICNMTLYRRTKDTEDEWSGEYKSDAERKESLGPLPCECTFSIAVTCDNHSATLWAASSGYLFMRLTMWLNDYRMWRQLKTYTHRVGALEICNMTLYSGYLFTGLVAWTNGEDWYWQSV